MKKDETEQDSISIVIGPRQDIGVCMQRDDWINLERDG